MNDYRSEWVDEGENGVRIDVADVDGIQIVEVEGDDAVYIYFSEIDKLIEKLEKVKKFNRSV